jgi:hypothetical protein
MNPPKQNDQAEKSAGERRVTWMIVWAAAIEAGNTEKQLEAERELRELGVSIARASHDATGKFATEAALRQAFTAAVAAGDRDAANDLEDSLRRLGIFVSNPLRREASSV